MVVNRDTNEYEVMWPVPSKSLVHDIVDAYLRDGVVHDELPVSEFKWAVKSCVIIINNVSVQAGRGRVKLRARRKRLESKSTKRTSTS